MVKLTSLARFPLGRRVLIGGVAEFLKEGA